MKVTNLFVEVLVTVQSGPTVGVVLQVSVFDAPSVRVIVTSGMIAVPRFAELLRVIFSERFDTVSSRICATPASTSTSPVSEIMAWLASMVTVPTNGVKPAGDALI